MDRALQFVHSAMERSIRYDNKDPKPSVRTRKVGRIIDGANAFGNVFKGMVIWQQGFE
jgi:hypothetical protein